MTYAVLAVVAFFIVITLLLAFKVLAQSFRIKNLEDRADGQKRRMDDIAAELHELQKLVKNKS